MVTAIITTHNRSNLLGRAIDSVLNQTYKDIEIIVISDGDDDSTNVLMEKYSCANNIRYIQYSPAKGGNFARNLGIKESKGEYIAFLDDDDEWYPTKIALQLSKMEQNINNVLVYTGVRAIYVNENCQYSSVPNAQGDLSHEILFENIIGSTSTPLIKKGVLEETGLFDENLLALQDYDLWIRICQFGRIGVVEKELINYYNYTNTTQVSSSTYKYETAISYINKKYENIICKLSPSELKRKRYCEYSLLGNKAMRNKNCKQARYYFKLALSYKFSMKIVLYYILSFTSFSFVLKLRSRI